MHDALCLIVDSGTRSKEDLLSVEFTMHPGDIENLVNLPSGWFSKKTGDVVSLTLKTDTSRGDCQLVFAYLRGARPLPVRRSFRQHSLSRGRKHRSWRGGMRWRRVDSVVGEKRC